MLGHYLPVESRPFERSRLCLLGYDVSGRAVLRDYDPDLLGAAEGAAAVERARSLAADLELAAGGILEGGGTCFLLRHVEEEENPARTPLPDHRR